MCQYLCETVGLHDNLIRSGNLTRSVNFVVQEIVIIYYVINLRRPIQD